MMLIIIIIIIIIIITIIIKGELKKAEELLIQCFEKQKECYGNDHHTTKHSSNALEIVRKKIEIKEQCYK